MAELLDLSPTRGNLLRLKDDLDGIRTQHSLLDRKREVLVRELMQRLEHAEKLDHGVRESLVHAHQALRTARLRTGSDTIEWLAFTPTAQLEVDVQIAPIMGLRLPKVQVRLEPEKPPYGLDATSPALDHAREKWLQVMRQVADAAEVLCSVWRLAAELRKLQRQVNALEHALIPRYEQTIAFIEERLEEDEREDVIRAHEVKKRDSSR